MVGMNMGVSLLLQKGTEHYMNEGFSKSVCLVPLDETFTVEVAFARYKKHHHTKASLAFWDFVKHTIDSKSGN
jgi:hypothetical protein